MRTQALLISSALSVAHAYHSVVGDPTWGALLAPDLTHPLVRGAPFDITWDPNYGGVTRPVDGVTVSLVLCRGNSNACNPDATAIQENIPAGDKNFTYSVPCDLPLGTQNTDTGYGMLVIVDQTGEYQYSTQFSVVDAEPPLCPAT
jgi:hypothetical protein